MDAFIVFIPVILIGLIVTIGAIALLLRRVVDPNEVHIVQSSQKTVSYGRVEGDKAPNGNTYYEWPSWIPVIGVTKIVLPVSIFNLGLDRYEAYDIDRVPFVVDIMAFFRIDNTNLAARRVSSFNDLKDDLLKVVQGAVRTVLASHKIDDIMLDRATFGKQFTEEVEAQLREGWGVSCVKNMELMNIEDADGSQVINDIMAKQQSEINMESRKVVADNEKLASIAEIEAQRETDLSAEQARQAVDTRKAEVDKDIGVANEVSQQQIKEQAKITAEKQMAVVQVEQVRQAEIKKETEVVKAEEQKQTTVIVAQGDLDAKKMEAEGIKAEGEALADAERQMQLAPVEADITLAKEIGENERYQGYLVSKEAIIAQKDVGIEQAKALVSADVNVIANSGSATEGMNNVMDMFTSKGGTNLAAMAEGLAQTEQGQAILERFGVNTDGKGNLNMTGRSGAETPPATEA